MVEAFIVHNITGRLRIKVPSKKGNILFFENLMTKLQDIRAIEKIEINALTGSIILYSSSKSEDLISSLSSLNILKIVPSNTNKIKISSSFKNAFKEIDNKVKGLTCGELNLADIVFLSLVSVAIYQIQRGNFIAPAWYTAIWYAMNILKSDKND